MKWLLLVLMLALGVGFGQPRAALEFEVASLKVAVPDHAADGPAGSVTGGPGASQIVCRNSSLESLLLLFYGVKTYQLSGPSWLRERNYDITAKLPAAVTWAEVREMVQNLLAERLHLRVHHETRQMAGYELSVAKSGLKIKEGEPAPAGQSPTDELPVVKDSAGVRRLPPGRTARISVVLPNGLTRVQARMLPVSNIVVLAEGQMGGSRVIDQTGLTGKYDFTLDYAPNQLSAVSGPDSPEGKGPDFVSALREQLGLILTRKNVPIDVLVVDSADLNPREK